jgi:hypothetical protein
MIGTTHDRNGDGAAMGPLSTGSPTLDVVLQIGVVVAMVVWLVLLIRRYRGR